MCLHCWSCSCSTHQATAKTTMKMMATADTQRSGERASEKKVNTRVGGIDHTHSNSRTLLVGIGSDFMFHLTTPQTSIYIHLYSVSQITPRNTLDTHEPRHDCTPVGLVLIRSASVQLVTHNKNKCKTALKLCVTFHSGPHRKMKKGRASLWPSILVLSIHWQIWY